jgi:hypothetical protein
MTSASITRTSTDGLRAIEAWMRERGVGWICAVSPHLDDAAFSIATLLAHPALPPREVWTVFSATTADGDMAYARATGFADPLVEFEARRAEDIDSMRIIGVPFRHVGLAASRFDAAAGGAVAADLRARAHALRSHKAASMLVLLPAGAGVEPSAFDRLWCRVTRRPVGCRPHGEHEWVRDALAGALAKDCLIGYYAEVPYLWSEGHTRLEARLRSTARQPLQAFAVAADVDLKHKAALAYRSQIALVLGDQAAFQRRSLSGDEWVYLPA